MKNIGKILKLAAAAVLCAACLLSLTGCGKDPAEYISEANNKAGTVHIACTGAASRWVVEGKAYSGAVEGKDKAFTVGGESVDISEYLPADFSGYSYGYVSEDTHMIEWTLWSKDPIPEEYKHELTSEEQDALADKKIFIGCWK